MVVAEAAIGQNINTPNKKGPLGVQVNTYSGNLFIPRNDIFIFSKGFNLNVIFIIMVFISVSPVNLERDGALCME